MRVLLCTCKWIYKWIYAYQVGKGVYNTRAGRAHRDATTPFWVWLALKLWQLCSCPLYSPIECLQLAVSGGSSSCKNCLALVPSPNQARVSNEVITMLYLFRWLGTPRVQATEK
jgi:hypothetical protein